MTEKENLTRAETIRHRREHRAPRQVQGKASPHLTQTPSHAYQVYLPVEPHLVRASRPAQGGTLRPIAKKSHNQRNGFTFTVGRTDVSTPTLTLPHVGMRLVSALLTASLAFLLYTLWTSPTFIVTGAEINGNQRLGTIEINAALRMVGESIFKAIPAQIDKTLRANYPDLANAKVHVAFPNRIIVDVIERIPLIAWYQNGALVWIDATGVAFSPRGDVPGLMAVMANGTPPPVPTDPQTPVYERSYVSPEMVQVMTVLYGYVPAGTPMIYDPQYGIGWQDARGWFVYFGQNTEEIPMKLQVYQAIVDTLTRQGIQPTLISVEYLDAPFYK